jgi:predicted MFS family arabinose efflux permease
MGDKLKKRLLDKGIRIEMLLFLILIAVVALGNNMGDSVFSNYFKEVYNVTASQRAFIEFPRELPGLLCALVIGSLSFLGDIKTVVLTQILACVGLMALGLFTPSFGIMLIFLFTNSLGMHLFMPLSDSIGMSLAEPDKVGHRMGQYGSIRTLVGFAAGIVVFLGFRTGFFSFASEIKWIFVVGACIFAVAIIVSVLLVKYTKGMSISTGNKKFRLVFRYRYRYYYILTILHGVQKQIAYVFGSWVIVDLLLKGADIMSLLTIISSFIGIFFLRLVGKTIDKLGVRFMLFTEALLFIFVYTIYGFVVWYISENAIAGSGWSVILVYVLFIMDRLSMQLGIVKSIYLRSIAYDQSEITSVLSTGTSLDHIVAILAAQLSGFIWTQFGPQYVFFMAAILSLGNLFVAWQAKPVVEERIQESVL